MDLFGMSGLVVFKEGIYLLGIHSEFVAINSRERVLDKHNFMFPQPQQVLALQQDEHNQYLVEIAALRTVNRVVSRHYEPHDGLLQISFNNGV